MLILGLGTNQGDRLYNLRNALQHLKLIREIKIVQVSSVYKSNALLLNNIISEKENLFYLNIAISCKTTLQPISLLKILKKLEIKLGRIPSAQKWAPRIIDIDILAWENKVINNTDLTIPHKELPNRPFVLWPFIEVAPIWYKYIKDQNIINVITENLNNWNKIGAKGVPLNTLRIKHRVDIPQIVGILNITPDSFSDGGKYQNIDRALEHAIDLFNSGADIIDIGSESTRPNATVVAEQVEWQRLYPIITNINNYYKNTFWKPKISIDTRHYTVAKKAIDLGIDWINDVSGLSDIKMCKLIAEANVHAVYMHNLGIPADRDNVISSSKDPVTIILRWAHTRVVEILKTGININKLIFDPGIGFGKNYQQNIYILKNINKFRALNMPMLVGHSRKSFLNLYQDNDPVTRDLETAVVSSYLARKNIEYIRVHNVEYNIRNLAMNALLN